MLLRKWRTESTCLTSLTGKKKPVLLQPSIDYIDEKYDVVAIKKLQITGLALYHLFEKWLDLIPMEISEEKEKPDPKNTLQFLWLTIILHYLFSSFVY